MTGRTGISVVIPVRDDAAALDGCLAALARQTVPPLEVIVVDNASRDASAAVARRWGATVIPEPRVGIPAAAATGYDAAAGQVIARLDADSVPAPDWLARAAAALAAEPPPDAVTGVGVFRDLPRGLRHAVALLYLGSYYGLGHAAAGHHVIWGSSMALPREAWLRARDRVRRDDAEVHDDLDLALALGPGARVRLDPTLAVSVSARSLVGCAQVRRRFRRAFHTLRHAWASAPPWERWEATIRRRLRDARPRHTETP